MSEKYSSLLFDLIHYGSVNVLKVFLEENKDLINAKNDCGYTPIMIASANSPHMVELFIDAGADLDIIDGDYMDGYTVIMHEIKDYNKPLNRTQRLIDAGANLNIKGSIRGETALMLAVQYRSVDAVKMLLNAGADPNIQDNEGMTALMYDGMHKPDLIQTLLDGGANTDLRCNYGYTALFYASLYHPKGIEPLVNAGADINAQCNYGWTPLMIAAKEEPNSVQTLIDLGADLNVQRSNGWTPLMCAAIFCHESVQPLIDAGADLELKSKYDQTALMYAAIHKPKSVAALLKAGADYEYALQGLDEEHHPAITSLMGK